MVVFNVDDDSDDREIFRDAVRAVDPHISCVQFESSINALQFLDKSDTVPYCLFIDMNMPKMSGLECVQRIRSIPRFLSIQIVMYSTTFNPNDHIYFSEIGIKCLVKPSKFSDIVSALKNLLLIEIPVVGE